MNIDNPYFEGMVNQIYLSALQLNKANASDTEAAFLCLHLYVSNGFLTKQYDKRDDFDFAIIVIFPFWMAMIPVVPLKGFTFHSLLGLLECAVM